MSLVRGCANKRHVSYISLLVLNHINFECVHSKRKPNKYFWSQKKKYWNKISQWSGQTLKNRSFSNVHFLTLAAMMMICERCIPKCLFTMFHWYDILSIYLIFFLVFLLIIICWCLFLFIHIIRLKILFVMWIWYEKMQTFHFSIDDISEKNESQSDWSSFGLLKMNIQFSRDLSHADDSFFMKTNQQFYSMCWNIEYWIQLPMSKIPLDARNDCSNSSKTLFNKFKSRKTPKMELFFIDVILWSMYVSMLLPLMLCLTPCFYLSSSAWFLLTKSHIFFIIQRIWLLSESIIYLVLPNWSKFMSTNKSVFSLLRFKASIKKIGQKPFMNEWPMHSRICDE